MTRCTFGAVDQIDGLSRVARAMRFLHLSDYGRCAFGGDPTLNRITLSRIAL